MAELPELRQLASQAGKFGPLWELAEALDALPRGCAMHTCGVILSNAALLDRLPVQPTPAGYPMAHAATLGIDLEIVQRAHGSRGFTPIPKRWTVERTYGRLMLHRRLARDYETLPARSETMIHLAMTDLMARRLTGEATSSWRDPTSPEQIHITG
ncbi:hypothetical protein GCM10017771_86660 [Streptomyces capitiformicae]|uniref:Transposase n=1 Tax=Streptomyces capitiformicae TaxID=2014920 RepID=A0A919DMH4_9ACTN|nr:hypothetical protein GCM10017771_86660 [Streptomyces capitiformicae]